MSLGRIDHQIFWLFYTTGDTLTDLSQLKGKRIGPAMKAMAIEPCAKKSLLSPA